MARKVFGALAALAFSLWALTAAAAIGTPTTVATFNSASTLTSTGAIAITADVPAHAALMAAVTTRGAASNIAGTDSKNGATYTRLGVCGTSPAVLLVVKDSAAMTVAGGDTVTINWTSGTQATVIVFYVTGLDNVNPVDINNTGCVTGTNSANTPISPGATGTPSLGSSPSEIAIAVTGVTNPTGGSFLPNSPFNGTAFSGTSAITGVSGSPGLGLGADIVFTNAPLTSTPQWATGARTYEATIYSLKAPSANGVSWLPLLGCCK